VNFNFDKQEFPKFPGIKKALGPGIIWLALAQGSGELIWWPYFIAKYGTALLPLLIPSALIQLPLTYHIGKYSMLTGESIWRGFFRLSKKLTLVLWILMNLSFFWFGSFVVAGGTALSELIPLGLSKKVESTIFGYILIILMFIMLIKAKKTYQIVEKFMWFVAVGTSTGLLISCLHPQVIKNLKDFIIGFFKLKISVVEPKDYEELITAITFMGLGGFWSLFYSYWIKEKGFGMSQKIIGFEYGAIPSKDSAEIKKWNKALFLDSSVGIFGNIITTLMTCFLAFSILHPQGLLPEGYKIAVVQSEFFRGWFGDIGVKIFLFSSALFLIDTWISTADSVAKTNVDFIKMLIPVKDTQKLYKILLVAITIITLITLPIAPPGELIVISAMIGFVGMVIFSFLILFIHVKMRKLLPKSAQIKSPGIFIFSLTGISYLGLFILYILEKILTKF